MYWCYQCEENTPATQFARVCHRCGSEAIQQLEGNRTDTQFRPYMIGEDSQNAHTHEVTSSRASNTTNTNIGIIEIPLSWEIQTVIIRSRDDPENITILRRMVPVFSIPEQPETVSEQTFNKLEKVPSVEECAICQESGKNGVKLPCTHCFHEECIKPWFSSRSTCPCCRTEVR